MSIFWRRRCSKNRGRRNIHKGDNRGSSMVAALVAIAFVAILASVVMTSTITNYKLKTMNYKSKKTFYSAESAMEEVRADLSTKCYDALEKSYIGMITNLSGYDTTDSSKANETANNDMRKGYLKSIYDIVSLWKNEWKADPAKMNSELFTDSENASILSIGDVTLKNDVIIEDEDGNPIPPQFFTSAVVINDIVVQYRESETDYFSTVAVDLVMDFPNVRFNLINDRNTLKTYLNFCMIGMQGIDVGNNTVSNVGGGAYAGNVGGGGINVSYGSKLNLVNGKDDTLIISASDVNLKGSMNINDTSKLWCENINLGTRGDAVHHASIFSQSGANIFVADDLNLEGAYCEAELKGIYYGFGADIAGTANSSGIIINGDRSRVVLSSLDKLLLGGCGFVNFGQDPNDNYTTADSISLRGNQDVYLVPTRYMYDSNPYAVSSHDGSFVPVDVTALKRDFFAASLLSETNPYKVVNVNGTAYVYLNFASKENKVKYINSIFNSVNLDGVENAIFQKDRNTLIKILDNSAFKFTNGELSVNESNPDIFSAGYIYQVERLDGLYYQFNKDISLVHNGHAGTAGAACLDKASRYKVLKYFLWDIADNNDSKEPASGFSTSCKDVAADNGDVVDVKNNKDSAPIKYVMNDAVSIYDYAVDTASLTEYLNKAEVKKIEEKNGDEYAVITTENYKLSDKGISKGVILGYGCDITVDVADFEGLIITNGKIIVTNGASIKSNSTLADKIIEGSSMLSQTFKAYQNSADDNQVDPSKIAKDSLAGFNNWRKNYVSEEATE